LNFEAITNKLTRQTRQHQRGDFLTYT